MRTIFYALALFITLNSPAWGEPESPLDFGPILGPFQVESHDAEVVRITQPNQPGGHGSGFIISRNLVATAAHVVVEVHYVETPHGKIPVAKIVLDHALITTHDGSTVVGEVVLFDEENDFALLRLLRDIPVKPVEISTTAPKRGDDVHTLGHVLAWDWAYSHGIVSQGAVEFSGTARILLELGMSFGGSGCPVYNANGEVVGVITQVPGVGGLALALPIARVLSDIQRVVKEYE